MDPKLQALMDKVSRVNEIGMQLADALPIPKPATTVDIGTLTFASWSFSGLRSKKTPAEPDTPVEPGQSWSGLQHPTTEAPEVWINAVDVSVRFKLVGTTAEVRVTVNGTTTTVPAGQAEVVVRLGRADTVDWSLQSGDRRVHDVLHIARADRLGVGAFLVPFLPIAIVYEPPQFSGAAANKVKYSAATTFGVKTTLQTTQDASESRPPIAANAVNMAEFQAITKFMGGKIAGLEDMSKVPLLKDVTENLAAIFGSEAETHTEATKVEFTDTREAKLTLTQTITTEAKLGPGLGDVYAGLMNVLVVWAATIEDGATKVYLSVLDYHQFARITAKSMLDDLNGILSSPVPVRGSMGPKLPGQATRVTLPDSPKGPVGGKVATPRGALTGFSQQDLISLLLLDPFVAMPAGLNVGQASLSDKKRFAPLPSDVAIGASGEEFSLKGSLSKTIGNATTKTTTDAVQEKTGWLSFLGLGVARDRSTSVSFALKNAVETSETREVTATVENHGVDGAYNSMDLYLDNVFGTFACSPAGRIKKKARVP